MTKSLRYATGRVLFYVLLTIIAFYLIFPFFWAIRSSLTPDNQLFATPVVYWPDAPTLANYELVLTNANFIRAMGNSAVVAATVTLLSLVFGVFAAYALGRFRFRGRLPVMYLILAMTMFPTIAVLPALFERVTQFHLYNTLWALIVTYLIFTLPFTVWVLTSFFEQMPRDLEEAAYVDGCTPFQTLYLVMLPLITPALVTTGLLAFIAAWNEFLFALSFIQSPDRQTVTLALFNFATTSPGGYEVPWGQIQAATVIVTVPLIVLVLIFQRRIIAGLTQGAVKG